MTQAAIEALLRQHIGLDANSIGTRTIARTVERRQAQCNLPSVEAYWQHLNQSDTELAALIEAIVVPETYFFRDQQPFLCLRQWLKHRRSLRILSAPCSTGEEPYSIAMTLLEAGWSTTQFQIDAIDISQVALQKAKQATYSPRSLRNTAVDDRYLQRVVSFPLEQYQVQPIVRKAVRFIQANLLEPTVLEREYDVIFCRNLLIYLAPQARAQVIHTLDRHLKSDGLLFVGSAEMPLISTTMPTYASMRHSGAFAYSKMAQPSSAVVVRPSLPVDAMPAKTSFSPQLQPIAATQPATASSSSSFLDSFSGKASMAEPPVFTSSVSVPSRVKPSASESSLSDASASLLEMAKRHFDRGQPLAALEACQAELRRNPMDAKAYLLLGEIYQALNDLTQAERSFRRAIYLDPQFCEALIHLALIKEQKGESETANILRARVQRLI